MRRWMERFEVQMMAAAFAEAGEHETALQLLSSRSQSRRWMTGRSRPSKNERPEADGIQKRTQPRMST